MPGRLEGWRPAASGACREETGAEETPIDAVAVTRDGGWVTRRTAARVPQETDDARLVRTAREGDPAAWADLHHRYAPMVHAILLSHAPLREVEDLVQDVFVKALQGLSRLRTDEAFGGWLARIARNRATDALRRKGRRGPVAQLPEDLPAHVVPTIEAREALAALRALPDAFRETLVMRLVEGMSGPEIAARTGRTPGSVRVNLHRGMKHLRESLGWSA